MNNGKLKGYFEDNVIHFVCYVTQYKYEEKDSSVDESRAKELYKMMITKSRNLVMLIIVICDIEPEITRPGNVPPSNTSGVQASIYGSKIRKAVPSSDRTELLLLSNLGQSQMFSNELTGIIKNEDQFNKDAELEEWPERILLEQKHENPCVEFFRHKPRTVGITTTVCALGVCSLVSTTGPIGIVGVSVAAGVAAGACTFGISKGYEYYQEKKT